jgi:uncharacterized membrane protein YesL
MNWQAVGAIVWTVIIACLAFQILFWGYGKLSFLAPFQNIILTILVVAAVVVGLGLIFGNIPLIPFCAIGTVNACAGAI